MGLSPKKATDDGKIREQSKTEKGYTRMSCSGEGSNESWRN